MRTTTANKQLLYLDVPQRLLRRPFPRIARRFSRGLTQRHRSARVEPARVDDGEEGEGVRVRGHAAAALGHDAAAGRRAVQHRVRKAVVESAAEGARSCEMDREMDRELDREIARDRSRDRTRAGGAAGGRGR